MRGLVLTGALACALCAGAIAEEDIKGKPTDPASQTVIIEEADGTGQKAIDESGQDRETRPNDGGVDESGAMPSDESYDENTGLPDRVPSDTEDQLD
jgi:hypothetical protein